MEELFIIGILFILIGLVGLTKSIQAIIRKELWRSPNWGADMKKTRRVCVKHSKNPREFIASVATLLLSGIFLVCIGIRVLFYVAG